MNSSITVSNPIPIPSRSGLYINNKKNNSLIFSSEMIDSSTVDNVDSPKYSSESNIPNQPITATPPDPHMINRLMIMSKNKK